MQSCPSGPGGGVWWAGPCGSSQPCAGDKGPLTHPRGSPGMLPFRCLNVLDLQSCSEQPGPVPAQPIFSLSETPRHRSSLFWLLLSGFSVSRAFPPQAELSLQGCRHRQAHMPPGATLTSGGTWGAETSHLPLRPWLQPPCLCLGGRPSGRVHRLQAPWLPGAFGSAGGGRDVTLHPTLPKVPGRATSKAAPSPL